MEPLEILRRFDTNLDGVLDRGELDAASQGSGSTSVLPFATEDGFINQNNPQSSPSRLLRDQPRQGQDGTSSVLDSLGINDGIQTLNQNLIPQNLNNPELTGQFADRAQELAQRIQANPNDLQARQELNNLTNDIGIGQLFPQIDGQPVFDYNAYITARLKLRIWEELQQWKHSKIAADLKSIHDSIKLAASAR